MDAPRLSPERPVLTIIDVLRSPVFRAEFANDTHQQARKRAAMDDHTLTFPVVKKV